MSGIAVLDDADLAGGLPAADAILRSLPGHEIQTPAQVLAAQRALDPDWTLALLAPRIAAWVSGMPARVEMATANPQGHAHSTAKLGRNRYTRMA